MVTLYAYSELQIYVVDSLDRERIGKAKAEFQAIINDPLMLNSVILVFANKQDMVRQQHLTPFNMNIPKNEWLLSCANAALIYYICLLVKNFLY